MSKMNVKRAGFGVLAALTLVAGDVTTEATAGAKAKVSPLPMAEKLVVPAGTLMRVDEGVFDLEIGKTIGLTNGKILLGIQLTPNKGCCEIRINGDRVPSWTVGSRIDLKDFRASKKFVSDREACFLDIVDVITPKGGKGTATFRLHCI